MSTQGRWLAGIVVVAALQLGFAGAALAQTKTTIDVRNFEVISVDGNRLVVRDERGTNEITVPADFRFTVDGKQLSVAELKAGMKGTATISTTTTIKPVVVTEVREGEVLRASDMSVTLRQGDDVRRYTRGELDAKGIQIYKDGKPILIGDLKKGDKLTAMIVTNAPPTVLTKQEVEATLAEAGGSAPTKVAAATPAAPSTPAAAAQPAAAPPAAPSVAPSVAPPAPPAERTGLGPFGYLVIALLIAAVVFFFVRRRKQP